MKLGSEIYLWWVDASTDSSGDPKRAGLYVWRSPGWYEGDKEQKIGNKKVSCVVLRLNEGYQISDSGDLEQDPEAHDAGCLCVPKSWVLKMEKRTG